jgi:hypothetical protein
MHGRHGESARGVCICECAAGCVDVDVEMCGGARNGEVAGPVSIRVCERTRRWEARGSKYHR